MPEKHEKENKYITRVSTLEEALSLAERWKEEGKFDLFRGQALNWPVVSTRFRIKEKDFDKHEEKFLRFLEFFTDNEELKRHIKSVDEIYAIAQHYGLITNHIDFSKDPKVAAYFATNSNANIRGQDSCIVCLNSTHFKKVIEFIEPILAKHLKGKDARPQIVDIYVKNLWRLQAQKGVFLYSPFPNLETIYMFDRILFPFNQAYRGKIKDQIYPTKKSRLELDLDRFFETDWKRNNLLKIINLLGAAGIKHLSALSIFDYISTNCKWHRSWRSVLARSWKTNADEPWRPSEEIRHIILECTVKEYNCSNIGVFETQILELLSTQPAIRKEPVNWHIIRKHIPIRQSLKPKIEYGCSLIWDGMRLLPYTNLQIARAISRFVFMVMSKSKFPVSNYNLEHFNPFINRPIYIEISSHDGSSARAFVSGHGILEAKRKGIDKYIKDEFVCLVKGNPVALVQLIFKPQYLFNFDRLVELFSEDIIPSQVALKMRMQNPLILFNPAYLNICGLA